ACDRLQLRAVAELAAGQTARAFEDTELIFYMADSLKDEPIFVSQLVRLKSVKTALQPVWEGLVERRWSAEQINQLQVRLNKFNFLSDLNLPVDGERAASVLTIDYLRRHGNIGQIAGDTVPSAAVDCISKLLPSGWYRKEQLNYCRSL